MRDGVGVGGVESEDALDQVRRHLRRRYPLDKRGQVHRPQAFEKQLSTRCLQMSGMYFHPSGAAVSVLVNVNRF